VAVDEARRVIQDAIGARTFPAAALEVGAGDGPVWAEAFGTLTFDPGAQRTIAATIFDLASLAKPIATTSIVMELVRSGVLRLDAPVAEFFEDWRGADREHVTIRDLLEHASGLPARLVDQPPATRREFEHDVCTIKLEYEPRTRSVYSDLGFILLGFIGADRGDAPLAEQFDGILARLKPDPASRAILLDGGNVLTFHLAPAALRLAAPTMPMPDDLRRGRLLVGDVHDNYAAALGGVAGHAGLFGTASAVGDFARTVLRASRGDQHSPLPFSPALVAEFTARGLVPRSSRALGWDTMLPTSSCGTRMSAAAFGHVGFTGTSLWIDPERDRYFVLLTNRACGGGTLDDMREVRRAFHDALGDL
jgi:CubicO group peptidase (beta-lactamase class C family)